jgi:hypothetical protein
MKHSLEALLGFVYRYHPRALPSEDPRYKKTEEYLQLSDARRHAYLHRGAWDGMLQRLESQFPEKRSLDGSHPLITGDHDESYSGSIFLDPAEPPGDPWHAVKFLASILCPYYVIYSERVDIDPATSSPPPGWYEEIIVGVLSGDTAILLPAHVTPDRAVEIASDLGISVDELQARMDAARRRKKEEGWRPSLRSTIRFDFSSDEQPYADWIARDIEATFGYEPMPPVVGNIIVPDVATERRALGEARLYDCLLSDSW